MSFVLECMAFLITFNLYSGLAKDFGQASLNDEEEARALTICGTQECAYRQVKVVQRDHIAFLTTFYFTDMAPEMIARKGYGRAADYWSLGCLAYEMLNGLPPFTRKRNEGSKDLFRKIMTEKVKMPSGASANACKLLKGLLNRNVESRLGTTRNKMFEVGGVAAIKKLPFFEQIDWEKLDKKDAEPPVRLSVDNEHDLQHFHDEFVNMALPRSVIEMSKDDFTPRRVESEHFRGFSFIQDGFALPERDQKQLEAYWNCVEEDGESASEIASSKCENEDTEPVVKAKKKRPPRKRKQKKATDGATDSAPCTPAQSAAGSLPPSEAGGEGDRSDDEVIRMPAVAEVADTSHIKTPGNPDVTKAVEMSQNGTANDKDTLDKNRENKEEPKKVMPFLNPASKAWTPAGQQPKAWSTPSTLKTGASVASSKEVIPPPKPAVERQQSVGSSPDKLGNNNTRPTPWTEGQAKTHTSKANNGWSTVPPGSGRGIAQQPGQGPRVRTGGNLWGAPAPTRAPPAPSDAAASASSDWRYHAMSPRTPSGARPIRKTPLPPQQQTWPSLDDPPLPSKATPKPKTTASNLRGAWAGRG